MGSTKLRGRANVARDQVSKLTTETISAENKGALTTLTPPVRSQASVEAIRPRQNMVEATSKHLRVDHRPF